MRNDVLAETHLDNSDADILNPFVAKIQCEGIICPVNGRGPDSISADRSIPDFGDAKDGQTGYIHRL
jgi:hypothetical protein